MSKPENSANQSSTKLVWVETINLGVIIHTTTGTYNICKFQAKGQNTDAGQDVVDWGLRGLEKHAKTPCGHPSIHHTVVCIKKFRCLFSKRYLSIFLCAKGSNTL